MNKRETITLTYQGEEIQCCLFTIDTVPATWRFPNVLQGSGSYAWQWIIWTTDSNKSITLRVGNQLSIVPFRTSSRKWSNVYSNVDTTQWGNNVDIVFNTVGTYYCYHTKLEKGDTITDWSESDVDITYSMVQQTANMLSWIVASGTSASTFTLTPRTAELVAEYFNISGNVSINGSILVSQSVTADKMNVNSLQALSAVLGGFLIVDNNITNTNSSTDITQNPQIKFERNTGNAYEYAYVIYSFPTYELYYRDVVTNMSSHYPTDVKISINDKGNMTWKYNLYPSTGADLPEESDYEATPTQTYTNSMGLPLELGSDIFSHYYGNGVEFEVAQGKQIKMYKTNQAVGETPTLEIGGTLKTDKLECKSFTNVQHDRRSATIGANVGTGFALQYATDVIGNNPIVQITLGNRYFRVSNISISTSGTNTIVTISIVNESNSQQTGMVYTSLFYSHNYG